MLLLNNAKLLVALPQFKSPKLKSSATAVLVCQPFQILFFFFEEMNNTFLTLCQCRVKTECSLFEKSCELCFQPPSQSALWYCLLCWHGICSLPPRSLTDNRSPLAGPPRANRNLLPVSHAEPRRQKITLKKRKKENAVLSLMSFNSELTENLPNMSQCRITACGEQSVVLTYELLKYLIEWHMINIKV